MTTRDSSRPLASLMTQIISEVAYLLQTEIRLARAELSEKLSSAANGGAMVAAAAIVCLAGLFMLLFGAVRWLEIAGLPNQWGFVLVGGLALAVGMALALAGTRNLKGSALIPERTIEQLRADISMAKERTE
jgi:hypothetical protein